MSGLLDHRAVLALLGILVSYLVVTSYISYKRLSHIPGPRLAAFSKIWLLWNTAQGDLYKKTTKLLHKHGAPVRIAPDMVIMDDADFYRQVNAPRSPVRRGHWYTGMKIDPRLDNVLSERDEKRHAELRAKMMPGYSGKEVPGLEANIDARVLDLVALISSYAKRSASIDMAEKLQFFTLDSLTDIAFGAPFGYLTEDKDLYSYNATSTAFFPIMEMQTNSQFVHSILNSRIVQYLAGPKAGDETGLGAVIGIAAARAADRFKGIGKKQDLLNSFIAHGMTQLECESESTILILAGADSTATTMRMTLLCLLTNPPVYARLLGEVTAAQLSAPVVKNSEASTLPYLQACIHEGLRWCTPLNGIVTRDIPAEGVHINGIFVPGGTEVGVAGSSMMRNPKYFGKDSDLFIPERWLTEEQGGFNDPETLKKMERVWELNFASGRSTCLGKGIAMMELSKLFVELFRRFDMQLCDPVRPIEVSYCSQLFVQRGMWVRAVERRQLAGDQ